MPKKKVKKQPAVKAEEKHKPVRFYLSPETIVWIENFADRSFGGNRSLLVQTALDRMKGKDKPQIEGREIVEAIVDARPKSMSHLLGVFSDLLET